MEVAPCSLSALSLLWEGWVSASLQVYDCVCGDRSLVGDPSHYHQPSSHRCSHLTRRATPWGGRGRTSHLVPSVPFLRVESLEALPILSRNPSRSTDRDWETASATSSLASVAEYTGDAAPWVTAHPLGVTGASLEPHCLSRQRPGGATRLSTCAAGPSVS